MGGGCAGEGERDCGGCDMVRVCDQSLDSVKE